MSGLRERKKAETRRAIAKAALLVSRMYPSEQRTIAQICKVADVSQRTFHNYFSSQEEAAAEFIYDTQRSLVERIDSTEGDSPYELVKNLAIAIFLEDEETLDAVYTLSILNPVPGEDLCVPTQPDTPSARMEEALSASFIQRFPNLDEIDLGAQLFAAGSTAQFAVMYYLQNTPATDKAQGVEIIKRAFKQFE